MCWGKIIVSRKSASPPVCGSGRLLAHCELSQAYEALNMIRKGQLRWLAKGDVLGQVRFIEQAFDIAA
jgi:hypothetical protein